LRCFLQEERGNTPKLLPPARNSGAALERITSADARIVAGRTEPTYRLCEAATACGMPFVRLAISRLKPKQIRQRTFQCEIRLPVWITVQPPGARTPRHISSESFFSHGSLHSTLSSRVRQMGGGSVPGICGGRKRD